MLFSNEKGELYWNEKNIVFQKKNILFRSFLCTEMLWLVPAILLRLKFQNTHRLWVIYGQLVCYVNKWLSIAQLWWLLLWAIAQCLYSVRPEPSLVGIWPAAWSCHQVAASGSAGFQIFETQSLDPILLWSTTWGMGIQGGHCTAMSGTQSAHGLSFHLKRKCKRIPKEANYTEAPI